MTVVWFRLRTVNAPARPRRATVERWSVGPVAGILRPPTLANSQPSTLNQL